MRRAWIVVVAVAALALPSTAFAHGGDRSESSHKNRSQACKSLRAQMGAQLFRHVYGSNPNKRNAHGRCVSKQRRAIRRLTAEAVSDCRAQREATQSRGSETERGDDRRAAKRAERRAFRRCVRARVRALLVEWRASFRAAARTCLAELKLDPVAFRLKYSNGGQLRHPFFRCVVQTVRATEAAKRS